MKFKKFVIDLRTCSFLSKIITVESAGAIAAIVYDNEPNSDYLIDMIDDGTGRMAQIPSVFLSYKDGSMIKDSLSRNNLKAAKINIPLNLTYRHEKTLKRAPWSFW